jgi:hypothetical protein
MGEGNATKGDLRDLARRLGAVLADFEQRSYSLALSFDCLVTVLGKADEVKAELERRKVKAEAEAKAKAVAP